MVMLPNSIALWQMPFVKNSGGKGGLYSPASHLTSDVVDQLKGGAVKVDEQDVVAKILTIGKWIHGEEGGQCVSVSGNLSKTRSGFFVS